MSHRTNSHIVGVSWEIAGNRNLILEPCTPVGHQEMAGTGRIIRVAVQSRRCATSVASPREVVDGV